MGNLFIGFPVPRAKIADMIEGAAPPLEHVVNHLPPGSDPIVLPGDISLNEFLQWNGTKFVGAAAGGNGVDLSPMAIHPAAFSPREETTDYFVDELGLKRRTSLDAGSFYAPVSFPHGATITKLILHAYRDDSDAAINLQLYRNTNSGNNDRLALCIADWTNGNGSIYDDDIDYSGISNVTHSYCLKCYIEPNDDVGDVILKRAIIYFS